MIEASNAPAVPGAKGEKPEPKPVPINTGRNQYLYEDATGCIFMNQETFEQVPIAKENVT